MQSSPEGASFVVSEEMPLGTLCISVHEVNQEDGSVSSACNSWLKKQGGQWTALLPELVFPEGAEAMMLMLELERIAAFLDKRIVEVSQLSLGFLGMTVSAVEKVEAYLR